MKQLVFLLNSFDALHTRFIEDEELDSTDQASSNGWRCVTFRMPEYESHVYHGQADADGLTWTEQDVGGKPSSRIRFLEITEADTGFATTTGTSRRGSRPPTRGSSIRGPAGGK